MFELLLSVSTYNFIVEYLRELVVSLWQFDCQVACQHADDVGPGAVVALHVHRGEVIVLERVVQQTVTQNSIS